MKPPCLPLFFCVFSLRLFSQPDTANKGYVDFHIHTVLKNYYREIHHPDQAYSPTLKTDVNWTLHKTKRDPTKFNKINSVDQATYLRLVAGNASILCTSLYTLEKQSVSPKTLPVTGLIQPKWLRTAFQNSSIALFDHLFSLRFINRLAVTGIGTKRQRTAFDERVSNFSELRAQLEFLKRLDTTDGHSKPVVLATPGSDLNDKSKIWLVLTVEGAHNFYGNKISNLDQVWGYSIDSAQEPRCCII